MNHTFFGIGLFSLFCSVAVAATAPANGDSAGKRAAVQYMGQLDADGSKGVTKDEFLAPHLATFAKLDTNKDGILSVIEVAANNDRVLSALSAARQRAAKNNPVSPAQRTNPIGKK